MALRLALVSGAAALVFLGVRVARRGRCDRYKAYVKLLDLPPGPAAGSQVLAGLCFAIKDMCAHVLPSLRAFKCQVVLTLDKNASIDHALAREGASTQNAL